MAKPASHKAKKRKREEEADQGDDALAERLAAYGERFLQMFDDHDSRPAAPTSKSRAATLNGAESDDGGSNSSGSEVEADGDVVEHIFEGGAILQQASGLSKNLGAGSAVGSMRGVAARGAGPAGGTGGQPSTSHHHQQQQRQEELDWLKAERKRFMSSKATVVSGGGGTPGRQAGRNARQRPGSGMPGGGGADADAESVSREEFLKMQREVQLYGAAALDRKSKKKFEAEMLAMLGAKAVARPRIPAAIGYGMARKQAQREERALQEGIAAGMIQQKGMGKKKRREKAKNLDRGLMEDGGAFRPGMLRVKPPRIGGGGSGGGSSRRLK